jgi:hypothetical protein
VSARAVVPHLVVALTASGCGVLLPPPTNPDGGILIVPRSYHQAMETGGHVAHVGAAAPDGGIVACRACHDVDAKGFEAPGLESCRTCHAANASFHHGADAGLPDGGQVSCLSCHPFWVREGARPLTNWVCLDCHAQPMGVKKAVRVHDTACFFCHQPHREPFTRPPDCTACHDRIGLAHGAKGATVAETCMTCHEQHSAASEATKACLACHSNPREQRRPATLITQQALLDEGHTSCGSCHRPHRFAKAEVKPCESCHTNHPVLAKGATPKAHVSCIGCHPPHAPKSPPKTCQSCHAQVASSHPVKPDLEACLSCHPMHEGLPPGAVAKTCGSCHSASEFTGVVHAERSDGGAPLACVSCHAPHDFGVQRGSQAPCKSCHQAKLTAVAKVKNGGHATCGDCHAGLPHQPADAPKACSECHADKPATGQGHVKCLDCHEPHSGAASKSCRTCHPASSLEGLHAEAKHQTCTDCHGPHAQKPGFQRDGCRACHKDKASHQPKAERCTGCHLFREAKDAPGGVE